jgi:uncharacterized protein (TIGR02145 family)
MSEFNVFAPTPDETSCFSWFNLSDLDNPPNGGCAINFCKTPDGNCRSECVDIFCKNRSGKIEVGDKIYILVNGDYVLLSAGQYISSTEGVQFIIDSEGILVTILNCTSEDIIIYNDVNYYSTIEINGLIWFKENLRTTTYSDGTPIPNIIDDNSWSNDTEGSYAIYPESCYGYLYNWYAVNNSKGLCPTGWRIPTADDFRSLRNAYGGVLKSGQALKVQGDASWNNTNVKTRNISGFSAYPSGSRDFKGNFEFLGSRATFWSSTTDSCELKYPNALQLYCCGIYTNIADIQCDDKNNGYAIRCVKN